MHGAGMSRELDVQVICAVWPEHRLEGGPRMLVPKGAKPGTWHTLVADPDGAGEWWQLDPDGVQIEYMKYPGRMRPLSVPEFSTDIAAAFQVVEAMREKGWVLFDLNWPHTGNQWAAMFARWGQNATEGRADTAPEAICRAALAALETEAPEPVPSIYPADWAKGP